ncbi:Calx-beta domain-containing protein [Ferirhizobium litorale]|uniref:Calx-beta domain-containing protein n=1 Tax=Ferirhizobium litorale TaxID=2927786 RepID=UPI0028936724|nr:Calx-beta domain-containing protein [Fererhizobium litorale]
MATPFISIERADVLENNSGSGGDFVSFTVTLSEPSDEDVTISYRSIMGTAVDADFWSGTGISTLTIPAGQTTGLITLKSYGDQLDEVDESYWIELFNAKGGQFANGQNAIRAIGAIQDNDGGGSNLSLFVSDAVIREGNAGTRTATFEVHLSQAQAQDLTLSFRTVGGSAKAGTDFSAQNGTVTFLAGQTQATIDIQIKGDQLVEASEFFSLVVTPTADIKNGTLGSTGIARILDDDAGGSAMPTISVDQVEVVENNSGSGGPFVTFAVTLSRAFDEDVSVEYRARPGTAVESDFWSGIGTGTLTIAAGETTGLITLKTYGDQVDEVDESFWLDLFNAKGAKLAGGVNTLSALGVIQDDDGGGSNLSLFVSNTKVAESNSGTKTATFEINLSRAFDTDLTFAYKTVNGSALAGSDYVAKSGNVKFLAGQTMATVEVAIKGDTAKELNEFFSLVLTPTSEIKNLTSASTGIATILDNDTSRLPIISVERPDVLENNSGSGGPFVSFVVRLSKAATNDVTIDYQLSPETAGTDDFWSGLGAGTLTIAAGKTSGLITLKTYGDQVDEVDESFLLKLSNAKGAAFAGGEKTAQTIGVIRDEDGGGANLGLFVSDVEITEGNSGKKLAVFEVHLSQPHTADLTLAYKTANGTAKAGSDYVAEAGTVKFLAGQTVATVQVEIIGDQALEGREAFSLVLTPKAVIKNGTLGATGIASIVNDDTINEVLYGTAGNDIISGGSGKDQIHGLLGNDRLNGDAGNDTLYGGGASDRLVGGTGADDLYGGNGPDMFIFKALGESKVAASGRDSIFDFNRGQGDVVDLVAIDANTKVAGNQAFDFIGTAAFSGKAGELRSEKSASDTLIFGDVNGDGKADFAIHFDDALNFQKGYFLL